MSVGKENSTVGGIRIMPVREAHLDHVRTALESLVHDAELWELLNFLNQKRPGTRRSRSDKK